MRLYIIRHADPDYENDTITEHGKAEAAALAQRLASEKIDRLFSSPLGRARATAEYTVQATGMSYEVLDWTREIQDPMVTVEPYGHMAAWDVPAELLFGQRPVGGLADWWGSRLTEGPRVRQKRDEIAAHSDRFLGDLGFRRRDERYEITRSNREKIAVFCHGGFGLSWISHLLRIPTILVWAAFWLPPSSVTTILFEERSAEWAMPRCIGFADTGHLYAGGIPVRPRGLHGNID